MIDLALFEHPNREVADKYQKLIIGIADAADPTPCQINPEPYTGPWASKANASQESAENLCIDCPFMIQCREYGTVAQEPYGIYGGTRPVDRGIPKNYRA